MGIVTMLRKILGAEPQRSEVAQAAPETLPPPEPSPPPVPIIHPDDVFLVSYPKSGNTWLRFLIGNYLSSDAIDFVGLHRVMPDLHLDPSLSAPAQSRPRFVKSHGAFDAAYPRVVYIVRDPRDVAVSSFFHHRKFNLIDKQQSFEQFIQSFIDIGFYPNGPWDAHVEGWLATPTHAVIPVKYEEMLRDPGAVLEKVLAFASLDADVGRVARAVERSSFERMRSIEDAQHEEYFRRYGSDTTEIRFVREGRAGSWRQFFPQPQLEQFMQRYGETMRKFGYV